ncbi:MAG: proline--tRNA ligase [Anaerolineae bacterium]
MSNKGVTPQSEDFSQWYLDVIREAELADYAPVKGSMVIRPYGYAVWENVQAALDERFKATGHKNAYFPLFIPYSFIQKESEHVEGFAPELALVTIGGGEELEEPYVVRPTSETIINAMFAKWIQSYRDLPLLINQWCNVVRWEKRTKPFLRTLEFLWQEGHTAHATPQEAEEEAIRMLGVYQDFAENVAAVPVVPGRKSDSEKFAGAIRSYTIEAMMRDMRALQSGTSHNLGDNFARAFESQYLDENNELQYVHQTSWGLSTRFVGAIIMVHGDDQGLRLPPRVAPIQVVFVPIWRTDEERAVVMPAAERVAQSLPANVRVEIDRREGLRPGFKFNDWEMRGVPVRIDVGPRDVENDQVVIARRDVSGREGKSILPMAEAPARIPGLLEDIQASLFKQAKAFLRENSFYPETLDAFRQVVPEAGGYGFAYAWWCGSGTCEDRAKAELGGTTIRCIPFEQPEGTGTCLFCGAEAEEQAVFAKAY